MATVMGGLRAVGKGGGVMGVVGVRESMAVTRAEGARTPLPGKVVPVLTFGAFQATTYGLQVVGEVTLAECAQYLAGLTMLERTVHWCIGDLLLEMEARFGEEYAQVVEELTAELARLQQKFGDEPYEP